MRERWQPSRRPPSLSASAFPMLRPTTGGSNPPSSAERPAGSATLPGAARSPTAAEPNLEERIAQAVAAAMAQFTEQFAAWQAGSSTLIGASSAADQVEDAPTPAPEVAMDTSPATTDGTPAPAGDGLTTAAAAGVADVAPVIAPTGAAAGVADVAGAETVAALQAAARIQSLGARIQSLGAPPASYADKTGSAPY